MHLWCQELDLAESVLTDISEMQKQHESMRVAHAIKLVYLLVLTLFVLLLGSKDLPSLSEVFRRLCLASLSSASLVSAIGDRSALVSFVGGSRLSSRCLSRGPRHFADPSSFGSGGGSGGRAPSYGSGGGGGRACGRGPWMCT